MIAGLAAVAKKDMCGVIFGPASFAPITRSLIRSAYSRVERLWGRDARLSHMRAGHRRRVLLHAFTASAACWVCLAYHAIFGILRQGSLKWLVRLTIGKGSQAGHRGAKIWCIVGRQNWAPAISERCRRARIYVVAIQTVGPIHSRERGGRRGWPRRRLGWCVDSSETGVYRGKS